MSNIKWKIGWGLSNKCNMACKFCYSRKVRREQKNFDNVIQTGIDFVKKNRNKILVRESQLLNHLFLVFVIN